MQNLELLKLPAYVNYVSYRISERASVEGIHFDFDRDSIISTETARLFYPSGGAAARGEGGNVLLERHSKGLHVAVFDHVTEAIAALALLPIHPEFSPANPDDPYRLAADFIEYCAGGGYVAPSHNPEATRNLIQGLKRALEAEHVAQVVLKK